MSLIRKIRNKITEKEAVQFLDGGYFPEVEKFCGSDKVKMQSNGDLECRIIVSTLEGDMIANQGDWIVKGLNGEFYPVKPDIFEKSYEFVD